MFFITVFTFWLLTGSSRNEDKYSTPYIYAYIYIYARAHMHKLHFIKFLEKPPAGLIETGNFVVSCKVLP